MAASRLMVDAADELFAVWDGQPARGHGGTADVVAYARERGKPVTSSGQPGPARLDGITESRREWPALRAGELPGSR